MTIRNPVVLLNSAHTPLPASDVLAPASIPVSASAGNTIVRNGDGLYVPTPAALPPTAGSSVVLTDGTPTNITLTNRQFRSMSRSASSTFTQPGRDFQVGSDTWKTFTFRQAGIYMMSFYAFLAPAVLPVGTSTVVSMSLFRLAASSDGVFNGASVIYPVALEIFSIRGPINEVATYPQRVTATDEYALILGFDSNSPSDQITFGTLSSAQWLGAVSNAGAWVGNPSSSIVGITGTRLSD